MCGTWIVFPVMGLVTASLIPAGIAAAEAFWLYTTEYDDARLLNFTAAAALIMVGLALLIIFIFCGV